MIYWIRTNIEYEFMILLNLSEIHLEISEAADRRRTEWNSYTLKPEWNQFQMKSLIRIDNWWTSIMNIYLNQFFFGLEISKNDVFAVMYARHRYVKFAVDSQMGVLR